MACELINPRADLQRIARELYEALRAKPCDCIWAWGQNGYAMVEECRGHRVMARYKAIVEAMA